MRTKQELKNTVAQAIDNNADRITAIADDIWKHPESGFREFRTAGIAANLLRELGLSVQEGIAYTGMRADLTSGKPGPKLALLGEMDALIIPTAAECDKTTGAFHGCGHHTHIASLLGAAIGLCLAKAQNDFSGTVAFMPCPAEECIELEYRLDLMKQGKIGALGGKAAMIRAGAFDDIDIGAMIHIGGAYTAMDSNAFVKKLVRFIGKSSHAAIPHGGINALSAANVALHALALMRETTSGIDPKSRIHGTITKGGDSINVIPDDVRLAYQLRASSVEQLRAISRIFDNAMNGGALSVGAKAEIQTIPGYWAMYNDRDLYQLYRKIAGELNPDRKIEDFISPEPGSTDMGDVSAIMPALHAFAPGQNGPGHSPDFSIHDLRTACVNMSKILAFLAIELLYGDAEAGKKLADRKKNCMSIPGYIKAVDSMKE